MIASTTFYFAVVVIWRMKALLTERRITALQLAGRAAMLRWRCVMMELAMGGFAANGPVNGRSRQA